MRYYFAPMEGLTDRIYRRLHHTYFPGADRYYMPFLSPTVHRGLTRRESLELPPASSVPFTAVPQVLTRVPEDFLWAARQIQELGYEEINLNAGCPSGTVVAKGKGAGLLEDPDALDRFLDGIFRSTPLPVSVKTRIGMKDPGELDRLMTVFNRYPIRELIVHPRVREDYYRRPVRPESLRQAVQTSVNPVCCSGGLNCLADIAAVQQDCPGLSAVMIGRGLIGDPGMLTPGGTALAPLEAFYRELLEAYLEEFGGSRNAMFRLKENWRYLICLFDGAEKLSRRLRKTTDLGEYRAITAEIFHTLPLRKSLRADW